MARNTSGWEYWNQMDFGNSWRPSVDTSQRNYKTKWLTDLGQIGYYPDQNYRGEGHVTSKIPLWKPGTERGYVTTGGKRGKGFYGNHKVAGGIKDPGLEIIDWEAYDKDPMYKGWLSSQGRDQFKTVEDIHSAEDWLIGGTKEKVARDELNALKLKLEREQTLRQEAERGRQHYRIDTGASPSPIGGIGSGDWGLNNPGIPGIPGHGPDGPKPGPGVGAGGMIQLPDGSWMTGHDYLNQARTQHTGELDALRNQLTNQWQSNMSAQDLAYQGQIADLKNQWGQQSLGFQNQIGGLQGQIGGLQTSLGEAQTNAQNYQDQVKHFQDMQIRNAEQARLAAQYGASGKPINPSVGGVRSPWLGGKGPRQGWYSPRNQFNRSGMRISGLNI